MDIPIILKFLDLVGGIDTVGTDAVGGIDVVGTDAVGRIDAVLLRCT